MNLERKSCKTAFLGSHLFGSNVLSPLVNARMERFASIARCLVLYWHPGWLKPKLWRRTVAILCSPTSGTPLFNSRGPLFLPVSGDRNSRRTG